MDGYKDHRTRSLLYDYINKNPGSTFKMLKSVFKIPDGTLRYHLRYLLKRNRIVQEKEGREKCYYSYLKKRFPFCDPDLKLNKEQERLLQLISLEPMIPYKDLKRRSGQKPSSFKYNIQQLKKKKLIWRIRRGNRIGYDLITEKRLADEMFLIIVDKYLDGEVDKETMMLILDKLEDHIE